MGDFAEEARQGIYGDFFSGNTSANAVMESSSSASSSYAVERAGGGSAADILESRLFGSLMGGPAAADALARDAREMGVGLGGGGGASRQAGVSAAERELLLEQRRRWAAQERRSRQQQQQQQQQQQGWGDGGASGKSDIVTGVRTYENWVGDFSSSAMARRSAAARAAAEEVR